MTTHSSGIAPYLREPCHDLNKRRVHHLVAKLSPEEREALSVELTVSYHSFGLDRDWYEWLSGEMR